MVIDKEKFEEIAEEVFNSIPTIFSRNIDNIHIVVEDYPSDELLNKVGRSKTSLLGLYQGIPLKFRGVWYGTSPTVPDKITLFQKNIESISKNENELRINIRNVLFHEIGHYFGMSEKEIREAMNQ